MEENLVLTRGKAAISENEARVGFAENIEARPDDTPRQTVVSVLATALLDLLLQEQATTREPDHAPTH